MISAVINLNIIGEYPVEDDLADSISDGSIELDNEWLVFSGDVLLAVISVSPESELTTSINSVTSAVELKIVRYPFRHMTFVFFH